MDKRLRNNKILFVFFTLVIGCTNPSNINRTEEIVIANFNDKAWREDSLGCENKRKALALLLSDSMQQHIVGKSKVGLLQLLGPPNIIHFHGSDSVYTYFVRPGRQCYDTLWRKNGSQAEILLIFINGEDKVSGFTGPVYP